MKPIYKPKGAAKEYGDYAINIYNGCPHRCFYCFAPSVLRKNKEEFHACVEPRAGIVEATKVQLEREQIKKQTIHLCFTCDPYPTGYDTTTTREIIKAIKESGNYVQILTKGDGERDFDLLDENDWYGITIDGTEPYPPTGVFAGRLISLRNAHLRGIKSWISFEPVINANNIAFYTMRAKQIGVDKVRIGKLNYHPSDIDWKSFGHKAEALCKELGLDYYIKDSLRNEMEK